ncbi:MAG: phosphatase PAP2 family protein, partial [Thermodesulfovibrio sp.]|nr:phosphatase PAP2 family protein [Thermodesulfovibrio sp.]
IFDFFFSHFYILGKGWIFIPIGLLLLIFKREKFWLLTIAATFETFSVHILKAIFKAPRPASMLQDVNLMERLYHGSFPSGDTAVAFVVATCLSLGSPLYLKVLLFIYAILIAYGRIYLGVHFPLDVVSGALIGVFSVIVAKGLIKFFMSKDKKCQNS